jgi:hypothetical protein
MKGRILGKWILAAAAIAPIATHAADVRPLFKAGYEAGGDRIVEVTFTNGDTASIHAGDGLYLAGGAVFEQVYPNIDVETSIGIKYDSIDASNGSITWTRYPVEVLGFYGFPRFRLGGGFTYQFSSTIHGSGVVGGLDTNIDNALGVILEADWMITRKISLGGRYTRIDYKANGVTATGDSVGISFGIRF